MINDVDQDWAPFCRVVEDAIGEFAEELRAIDLVDLITFIRFESYPTVEDLVNSSTELFFKPEMLVFSWVAGVDLRWDALPVVTLGLEFKHPGVSLFFNLTLREAGQSVDVLGITFDRPRPDPCAALAQAFADARLPDGAAGRLPPFSERSRKDMPWS